MAKEIHRRSAAKPEELEGLVAHAGDLDERAGGQALQLRGKGGAELEEFLHRLQAGAGIGLTGLGLAALIQAVIDETQGGVDLAAAAFVGNDAEHLEDVLHALKMIA